MPKMKALIDAGLFGRGLIMIDHPYLVARYNACLRDMNLLETTLAEFQIDRMGWSPEIAAEQQDHYYLSHGDANPLAIVLTPDQAYAPIYFPMHSFDWKLMEQWFSMHRTQIADLTKDTAIWLDIDQEVDLYRVPKDLLMVSEVLVRAHTPCGLMQKADKQQALALRWLNEKDAHLNGVLIQKLEESAVADGDLRHRHLVVRDMQYSDVVDFYSRVFGGIFVLRSRNKKPLIFAREKEVVDDHTTFAADESALARLIKQQYVQNEIAWWQEHLYRLKVVAESFLVEVLDAHEPYLDFTELNDAKRRGLVVKYQDELQTYFELEELRHYLKEGELGDVSDEVRVHLYHPNDDLPPTSREVVWQLLTYIQGGRFVPLMYRHQKTAFVKAFTEEWNMPRRSWALQRIRDHYDHASKSSSLVH